MTTPRLGSVLRYLRGVVAPPANGSMCDAGLLERFLGQRDQAAFEALVRRHGSMVLGVARGVLRDADAADDVFQATFLVLARKAHTLRKRASLASWLYGVAHRIALNARGRAARRRMHERRVAAMSPNQPPADTSSGDWPTIIRELDQLPEKYRAPLILCYVQGLTNEEAAEQLQWPSGTVKGRLARAREVLRDRLTQRGLAMTATALGAALADRSAWAAVPASLVDTTVAVALPVALQQASLDALAGPAAELAREALRTSIVGRLVGVALVGVLAAGGVASVWYAQTSATNAALAPLTNVAPHADVQKGRLLASFAEAQHYRGMPVPLAVSADGKRLVILARRDTEAEELFLQEIATGATLAKVTLTDGFRLAAADEQGVALVYGDELLGETRVEIRDLVSLKLRRTTKDKASVRPTEAYLAGDTVVLTGGHVAEAPAAPPAIGGFGGGFGGGLGGFPFAFEDRNALAVLGRDKSPTHALDPDDTLVSGHVFGPADKLSVILLIQRDTAHRVEVFDPATGKSRRLTDTITATYVTASADGKTVALQTGEQSVQVLDGVTGKTGPTLGDGDTTIVCMAIAPDGGLLATAGSDRHITIWDTKTGRVIQRLEQARVQRLCFATDGRTLAAGAPEELTVWAIGQ